MKILLVNNSAGIRGGTEYVVDNITKYLSAAGHNIIVVTGPLLSTAKMASGPAKYIEVSEQWLQQPFESGPAQDQFREIIEKENPSLIHIHNVRNPNVILTSMGMRPTVKSVHDLTTVCVGCRAKILERTNRICEHAVTWKCIWRAYSEQCTTRRPHRLLVAFLNKKRELKILRKLPKVIVHSNYVKSSLVQNGILDSQIELLPLFTRISSQVPENTNRKLILFVGAINRTKGLQLLIDALSMVHSEYRLFVAGEGEEIEQMKSLALKILGPDRVQFLGFVKNEELEKCYRLCSFVVVSSIWPEAVGLVGLEAMAWGKPVIAFNVGGIPEWLEHGVSGFLVERADTSSMGLYIDKLLKDEELTRRMGGIARKRVEKCFTVQAHLKRLLEVYEGLAIHGQANGR